MSITPSEAKPPVPSFTEFWRVDEVIECLPLGYPFDARTQAAERAAQWKAVSEELMAAMPDAYGSPDGVHDPESPNFREFPPEPDVDRQWKLARVWDRLSPTARRVVHAAYLLENDDRPLWPLAMCGWRADAEDDEIRQVEPSVLLGLLLKGWVVESEYAEGGYTLYALDTDVVDAATVEAALAGAQ